MLSKKIFLLISISVVINGCGVIPSLEEVLPDNRTKYQKSKALPDLEVPPDLTNEALNDPMAIPGEEDATTLSEFQRRKIMREGEQLSNAGMTMSDDADEKWLSVQGTTVTVWPKLREFWLAKGFALDLDDAELGVLETKFKDISVDEVVTHREKFMISSEEGTTEGNLILFLSSERQEKISDGENSVDWVVKEIGSEQKKDLIGQLNLHFHGVSSAASNSVSSSSSSRQTTKEKNTVVRAEIVNAGGDKEFLAIPDEFSRAWRNLEDVITNSGMYIDTKNKEEGLYNVLYFSATQKENKGLLRKLAFWESDEEDGTEYSLSLTGVGDKTEVIVLNDEDKWLASQDASRILSMLQTHYNRLFK